MRIWLAVPVLAIAGALAVAGCGGKSKKSSSASTPAPAPATSTATQAPAQAAGSAVTIDEAEYKLTPSDPTAKAGTVTFTLKNSGAVSHALEVEGAPGGDKKSATIAPGQTGTLTVKLPKAGKFEIYCPIDGHKGLGMKGDLTIT